MIGKSVTDVQLRQKFALNIVTIKRKSKKSGLNILNKEETIVIGTPDPTMVFEDDDIIVLFGKEKDFATFMKE